jgi:1,4-alpha-glucan branching enzyme
MKWFTERNLLPAECQVTNRNLQIWLLYGYMFVHPGTKLLFMGMNLDKAKNGTLKEIGICCSFHITQE